MGFRYFLIGFIAGVLLLKLIGIAISWWLVIVPAIILVVPFIIGYIIIIWFLANVKNQRR